MHSLNNSTDFAQMIQFPGYHSQRKFNYFFAKINCQDRFSDNLDASQKKSISLNLTVQPTM